MTDVFFEKLMILIKKYLKDFPGHGLDHILRVSKTAELIYQKEGGNLFIIKLASLLHDMDDRKINTSKSICYVDLILSEMNVSEDIKKQVKYILNNQSFSDSVGKHNTLKTIDAKIVQDADRLDAMGAIGLYRTLAYSFKKNRLLFDENLKPKVFNSKEEYIGSNYKGTSINHLFEKILVIPDYLNTKTAKEISIKKHKFIINFLEQFFLEYTFQSEESRTYWYNLLEKHR